LTKQQSANPKLTLELSPEAGQNQPKTIGKTATKRRINAN